MMAAMRYMLDLVSNAKASDLIQLLTLMLITGLSESIGLFLLIPFLIIMQGEASASSPLFNVLLQHTGVASSMTLAYVLLGGFMLLMFFRSLSKYMLARKSEEIKYQIVEDIRTRALEAILKSEWQWLVTKNSSDHLSYLLNDINRINRFLTGGFTLVRFGILVTLYLVAAMLISSELTLIAVSIIALIFLLLRENRRHIELLGSQLSGLSKTIYNDAQNTMASLKLVKIFGLEQHHVDSMRKARDRYYKNQMAYLGASSMSGAILQFSGPVTLLVTLMIGIFMLGVGFAEMIILVFMFSRILPMMSALQQSLLQCKRAFPALLETYGLLEEYKQHAEIVSKPEKSLYPLIHSLRVAAVSYQFTRRSKKSLDNVTLTINANTTVAIVGSSGAGKSTLADLLMGILIPQEGEIMIDGKPINDENRLQWRHSIAFVPQEIVLFNDSIRNNLHWSNPAASEGDMFEALHAASAEFVFDLPEGLDTVVGNQGSALSGGERQRIVLARALLKKPSLLILDEATSALDTESQDNVTTSIKKLHGKLTIVMIGHRLSMLGDTDQIIWLDQGSLLASGKWSDLKSRINGY